MITCGLDENVHIYIYIYCCWIGCGLKNQLNTLVPVPSHDLDFHRHMSYFMLSPPQPCTKIKTKSAICFMLKIFRFILDKNNRNMVFAYQIKNETFRRVQIGWFGIRDGPIYNREFGKEKRPIILINDFVYVSLLAFQHFLSYIMAVVLFEKLPTTAVSQWQTLSYYFVLSTHKSGIVLSLFSYFIIKL